MTRAFIADEEWVSKASRGESNRIRPCIGLNQDCRAFAPHLHCAVNVTAGRELLPSFRSSAPPAARRRIAIVGGGPAGLETARVAALRGHAVTLFEASDGVGGQFLYASAVPHRQGLRRFIDYLRGELRHLAVRVELSTRIERPEQLQGLFDATVIATGAIARPLDETVIATGTIGRPLDETSSVRNVTTWFDVLDKGAPAPHGNGRAVVVDDGSGFWWTYGVAEALAEAGWRVLLATPSVAIASAIPAESVGPLLARLGRAGTEFRVLSMLSEVTDGAAHLMNVTSGEEDVIACALVVVQTGRMPVAGLFETLRPTGMELHMIGDCVTPRRMSHAVFEGYRLACSL
jgi:2,4-dienoyl-CoA reductase (NADPH2)